MPDQHKRVITDPEVALHVNTAQAAIRLAIEILNQPPPSTFLGRKTQEPFPLRDLELQVDHQSGSGEPRENLARLAEDTARALEREQAA
jgi:hypothetical protein